MNETLDLFSAESVRDEALDRVALNSGVWMSQALNVIASLKGWTGTAEDMRLLISERGHRPHHHNAWGSLTRTAIKRGLLTPTGQYAHMRERQSHARMTPIYISRKT